MVNTSTFHSRQRGVVLHKKAIDLHDKAWMLCAKYGKVSAVVNTGGYVKVISLCLIGIFVSGVICAQPPGSRDLLETDARQRRDLSLPHSRLILNFFDFKSTNSACAYGTAANLPLHAAWLSTVKNDTNHVARSRFSRTVPELLMLYRAARPTLLESVRDADGSLATAFTTAWMPHAPAFTAR